ncbi:MAG: hypothetical protein KAT10_06865, partial [Sulfurimonas sp.]|nr:hypothetical protein [Sulfurimonas sp.]
MSFVKQIWSFLISMKLMVTLILIFAIASAVGTFIENDYGVNTSWALIYTSRWFEAVQILLGISIVGNIFRYKMIQKKKIPVLLFHIGFLVVLIGSGITRYYGHEGVMHIREGATEHRMLSSDAFLQIGAKKGSKEFYTDDVIYMSELGGREFDNSLDVDGKELSVTYKNFIGKAVKTLVENPNGTPMVEFLVNTPQGPEKFFLSSDELLDLGPLAIYFDKEPTVNNKPIIHLISEGDNISFVSNVPIKWLKMTDRSEGSYEVGKHYKFDAGKMYNINGIQLVAKTVLSKASVKLVSEKEYNKTAKKQLKTNEQLLSALIVDVEYNGEHREVALMGKGK